MAIDPLGANPLGAILIAVQARLQAIFPPAKFVHAVVPARLNQAVWVTLVRRTPFIGLAFSGLAPSEANGRAFDGVAQLAVFLITKAERPETRMLGDPQGPGLLSMVAAACIGLHGFTIGGSDPATGAGSISVRSVDNLFTDGWGDENAAIAGLSIEVPARLVELATLDDFVTLGLTWSFPDLADAAATETLTMVTT